MRKIVFYTATLLFFTKGFCQSQDSIPKIIFGFNLGLNYSDIQMQNTSPGLQASNGAGFRMGLLMDLKLTRRLTFSPKAELSFNDAKVTVPKTPDDQEIYEVYPALMEFATHVTYKFFNKKTTPYILIGPSYKVPINGNQQVKYETMRSAFSFDFGIGLENKLKFFNLAPEMRYSVGLTNISGMKEVGQLYFHTFTFVLNFKG